MIQRSSSYYVLRNNAQAKMKPEQQVDGNFQNYFKI